MIRTTAVIATVLGLSWLFAAGHVQAQTDAPPKKPGTVRIGVVKPQVMMGGEEQPGVADSVRTILTEYLRGPTIDVAVISARLESQYTIEAQQAGCDFLLVTSVTHERGKSSKLLSRALGNLAYYAPRTSSATANAVIGTALYTASDFASSIKAKDEMALAYRVDAVGGAQSVVANTVERRAKSDGEDLLTPLVENAAAAIGAAITAPRTALP